MPTIVFAPWQGAGISATTGFDIGLGQKRQHWQKGPWQESTLASVTAWEKEVATGRLQTFPHGQRVEILKRLNELKEGIGVPESLDVKRIAIVASIRNIAETCLLYVSRGMRRDPNFHPATHFERRGHPQKWTFEVFEDLKQERDNILRVRKDVRRGTFSLDGFYGARLHRNSSSWVVKGTTNVSRLIDTLHNLRENTHLVRRIPSQCTPSLHLRMRLMSAHCLALPDPPSRGPQRRRVGEVHQLR